MFVGLANDEFLVGYKFLNVQLFNQLIITIVSPSIRTNECCYYPYSVLVGRKAAR